MQVALDAVLAQLENPALPGIDLSLDRLRSLLDRLGNPQDRLPPVIHVAGTNGKGSTIAFLRAMLEADGKQVHAYISPPLRRFHERIHLVGHEIGDAALLDTAQRVAAASANSPVTSFEAITAVAFLAFSEHPADVLLLETGMGGRLDATNLVRAPIATVITPVGLDHQEFLGGNLAAIAAEKAGIMKPGVPCFSAPQAPAVLEVLRAHAQAIGAPFTCIDRATDRPLGLAGAHQAHNAALALATLEAVMPVSEHAKAEGLRLANWPGRLQRLTQGPLVAAWVGKGEVWLDGAHNAHAAQMLASWAKARPEPVVVVCGLMARKDAAAFFAPLAGAVDALVCIGMKQHADAQQPGQLAAAARAAGIAPVTTADDALSALQQLQRYKAATVLVAGSLYLAGEILKDHE